MDPTMISMPKVNSSGNVQWVTRCQYLLADDHQKYPSITSDGSGGAIIAWLDYRYDPMVNLCQSAVNLR